MSLVYNRGKEILGNGSVIWTSATIKAMLVTSGYTANADHPFVDSGSGAANPKTNECSGTGYVRKTLGTKATTRDDTNDRLVYSAADLTWTAPTGWTAAGLIVFHDTGTDTTAELIAFLNGGGFPKTTNGSDLLVAFATSGVLTLT